MYYKLIPDNTLVEKRSRTSDVVINEPVAKGPENGNTGITVKKVGASAGLSHKHPENK